MDLLTKAATSSCQDLKKKKLQEIRPLVLLLSDYYPPLHSLAARAVPAIPCHYPCIINANSAVSSPLMAVLKEEAGSRETLTISQGLFFFSVRGLGVGVEGWVLVKAGLR